MLKFVGDICLADNDFDKGFGVGSKLLRGYNPFAHIEKSDDEIWIGNMECVLSKSSERSGYNKDCFRTYPDVLSIDGLIDCYSVANNHIMEHGANAYKETIEAIKQCHKDYVGTKDQKTVVLIDCGKTISVTSFSLRCDNTGFDPMYWYNPEMNELKVECEKYPNVDLKVVYLHWGVEFVPYPYSEQQKIAHYLVDIGYDLIIGVHPHVAQGYEIYKNKHIYYSLGNFVFNMSYPETQIGLIVSFDPAKNLISHEYIRIDASYSPSIVDEEDVSENLRISNLNSAIGKYTNIEQYIRTSNYYLRRYRRYHHLSIIKNLFRYDFAFFIGMVLTFIKSRLT